MKPTLIVVLLFVLAMPVAAEDWPQFRGPTGDGISNSTNVPVAWSVTEHIAWKREIPGVGWSSPALVKGRLYLTTAVGEGTDEVSLRALCVDAESGRILWNIEVLKPSEKAALQMHSKNSLASPTPIVSGERLFVHYGHMGTAALDLDGSVMWRQTDLPYRPLHGNGGSPALVGDLLVISCDGILDPFVVALERESGHVRWKVPRESKAAKKFSFSTPTEIEVDGVTQVLSVGSGYIGAYAPADGREIWRVNFGEGYSVIPRPVYADGHIFISSGYEQAVLYAINPSGAKGDVTDTHVAWKRDRGAPHTPSVAVVGDEVYFVSDKGVATCADARTGNVHWTKRLGGDFSASPLVAEGRIYFENESGVTTIVKVGKEFESVAVNDIGERTLASPVPTDGALFIRGETSLYKVTNQATSRQ